MGRSVFKGKVLTEESRQPSKRREGERQEGKDRKLQNEVWGTSLVIQEVMYKKKKKKTRQMQLVIINPTPI